MRMTKDEAWEITRRNYYKSQQRLLANKANEFNQKYADNYLQQWNSAEDLSKFYGTVAENQRIAKALSDYYRETNNAEYDNISKLVEGYDAILADQQKVTSLYGGFETADDYKRMMDILSIREDPNYNAYSVVNQDELDEVYKAVNGIHHPELEAAQNLLSSSMGDGPSYTEMHNRTVAEYAKMTAEERKDFTAIWNKYGDAAAKEYLALIEPVLVQREAEEYYAIGQEMPFLGSVLSIPLNMAGSVEQIPNMIVGKTNRLTNMATSLRGGASSNMGGFGSFMYNTGMSAADSILASLLPGGKYVGATVLALSAAGNTQNDILRRGGTKEQAVLGGVAAGIAEAFFEQFSIGELQAMKSVDFRSSFKAFLKNISKEIAINASEETATEIANILSDSLIMGELSNFNTLVDNNISAGQTLDEAYKNAIWSMVGQVGEAAASGALMGFGMTAAGSGISSVGNYIAGNAITKEQQYYNKLLEKGDLLDLHDANNKNTAEARQLYSAIKGYEQSKQSGQESSKAKNISHKINVGTFNNMVQTKDVQKSLKSIYEKTRGNVGQSVNSAATAANTATVATKDADITKSAMPKIVKADGQKLSEIFVEKDGEVVSLDKLSVEDADLAMAYSYAVTTGSVENANAFLSSYAVSSTNASPTEFWSEWMGILANGQTLRTTEENMRQVFADYDTLSEEAKRTAWLSGVTLKQSASERRIKAAEQAKAEWEKDGKKITKGNIDASAIQGVELDAKQKEFVAFGRLFAEAFGMNVKFVASEKGKRGDNGSYNRTTNTITLDVFAGIGKNANYNAIQSALSNTLSHEVVHNMRIVSPEYYDVLSEYVFETLKAQGMDIEERIQYYIEDARKDGKEMSREDAVEEIVAHACDGMLRTSETVLEFMSGYYAKNKKAANRFSQAVKDTLKRLKNVFDSLLGVTAYSQEAHTLYKAGADTVAEIQKIFDKGVLAMREGNLARNYELQSKGGNAEANNGEMYSLRGVNKDGIEVYETSDSTMKLTWKDRIAAFEDTLNQQFVDKKARFVRNGHTYYAKMDSNFFNKVMYGEKHFSKDGKKAFIKAGADGDTFDLIENATYSGSRADNKNHRAQDGFTDYFDYFYKTVQIDNKVFDICVNVKKQYGTKDGYTYTLYLVDNNKIKASPSISTQGAFTSEGDTSDSSITQKSNVVNTKSKNSSEELKQNRNESEAEAELARLREQYNEAFRIEREAKKKVDAIGNFPRYDEMLDIISDNNNKEAIDSILAEYSKWQEESGYKAAYKELSNLEKNTRNLRRDIDVMEDNLSKALRERKYSEEEISSFVQKAVRKYHTTYSLNRAAYLLTTGSMLDFSEGQGYRVKDHREISEVLNLPEYAQYSDGMIVFMNMGNIRLQTYGIDISAMPNDKQISALRGIISSVMREYDEFTVDFSKPNGNSDGSVTYPKGVATSRIISDIKSYFETGKVPEYEDTLSQFMYSKRQEDADYLSAVERGDMETAQKMVDEAAKRAGYTIKAFHGTPDKAFTSFDYKKIGSNTDAGIFGHGFYFTTDENTAKIYATEKGNTMPVFLKVDKAWWAVAHRDIEQVAEELGMSENALTLRGYGGKGKIVTPTMEQSRQFSAHLKDNGYNSVIVQHGKNNYEIVVFDSSQVKSSDPVTYDEDGKVIPLSKRFNAKEDDIRYQARRTDTIDNEYLNAVNNGDFETAQKLVDKTAKRAGYNYHLYHGTNADFTKFDLHKHGGQNGKGEGYGIYLAKNREISAPYGKNVIDAYVKFHRLAEGRNKTLSYSEVKNLVKRSCEIEAQRMVNDEEYDSVSEALRDTWVSNVVYTYDYSSMAQVYADVANKLWKENDNDGDLINEIMALSGAHYDYTNALDFYDNILIPVTEIDGFHYIWGNKDGSGEQNDIYLAFGSNQIKSADPVTYDDKGNIIPLSQRFDSNKDDIRYQKRQAHYDYGVTQDDINNYVDAAYAKQNVNDYKKYAVVSSRLVEDVSSEINIKGYAHALRDNDIRHIRNSHGENTNEKYPVTKNDLKAIPWIVDNYDKVVVVKRKDGRIGIIYVKAMDNGLIYYLEQVTQVYGNESLLINKQMIKTGISDIPDIKGLKDAIIKKQSEVEFLNDLRKAPQVYVQDVYQLHSNKSIPQNQQMSSGFDENSSDKLSQNRIETPDPSTILKEVIHSKVGLKQYGKYTESLKKYQDLDVRVRNQEKRISEIDAEIAKLKSDKKQSGKGTRMNELHRMRKTAEEKATEYRNRMFAMEANELGGIVLAETKKAREEAQRAASEKYRAKSKERTENIAKRQYIEKIENRANRLTELLKKNSKDKHVPEIFQNVTVDFLEALDFSSQRYLNGGVKTKKEIALETKMKNLVEVLDGRSNGKSDELNAFLLATGLTDDDAKAMVTDALKTAYDEVYAVAKQYGDQDGTVVLQNLSSAQLRNINNALGTLSHLIGQVNELVSNGRYKDIAALGKATVDDCKAFKTYSKQGIGADLDKFFNWTNALPYYAFKRMGKGAMSIFEAFMDGFDVFTNKIYDILDFADSEIKEKDVKKWSKEIHKFEISKDEYLYMSTADIMSFYCLDKREQGSKHIRGGGINVPLRKGHLVGETETQTFTNNPKGVTVTDELRAEILSKLTSEQIEVASKLQEFMSTVCAEWGNEISMKRFGVRQFTEKYYFPVQSSDNTTPKKDQVGSRERGIFHLLNASFTQAPNDNANNRIVVDNIFDVFATHCVEMAKYNAYALQLIDTRKWLNYKVKTNIVGSSFETEELRAMLENAFGKNAEKYIDTFLIDINGAEKASDRGFEVLRSIVGNAKIAAVGLNLNVMIVQPTAYFRASAVISPKYLVSNIKDTPHLRQAIKRAEKYSGIFKWKNLGYRGFNLAAPIADKIKHTETFRSKFSENVSMKGAELMDKLTWGALWMACENEVADLNKSVNKGTPEYYEAVSKRFREVVYSTQVVDSPLTKTEFMRSKGFANSLFGAFMSEPSTSYNMVVSVANEIGDTLRKGQKVEKKHLARLARVGVAFAITEFVTAMVRSLLDAARNIDDEDEEYWELYLKKFAENFLEGLLLPKVPIISDILSAIISAFTGGYSSSSLEMSSFERISRAAKNIWNLVTGKDVSWTRLVKSIFDAFSTASGLPLSNLWREVITIINIVFKATGNEALMLK